MASTALGLSVVSPLAMLLCGLPAVAFIAAIGLVLGIIAIVRMKSLPPVPADAHDKPGAIRLSARLAKTAPAKAWGAIVVGGLILLGSVSLILLAMVAVAAQGG